MPEYITKRGTNIYIDIKRFYNSWFQDGSDTACVTHIPASVPIYILSPKQDILVQWAWNTMDMSIQIISQKEFEWYLM